MNIGIVILTKGNLDYLFKCLDTIVEYTKKVEYTVYIADTGSTTDEQQKTIEYIQEKFSSTKNCNFYKLNFYNFAKCNNFIINEVVKEDYILLCNNDIELTDNSIDILTEKLSSDPKIGTVGCRLVYPQNKTIQHAGQFCRITRWSKDEPEKNRKVLGASHLSCGHRGQFTTNKYSEWEPVMGNTGGYMFVKKDVYLKLGGLNEKYRVCFEDVEFNMATWKAGLRNMYSDTSVCMHYESLTRGSGFDVYDHQHLLTSYFNSLNMDVKNKLNSLPYR